MLGLKNWISFLGLLGGKVWRNLWNNNGIIKSINRICIYTEQLNLLITQPHPPNTSHGPKNTTQKLPSRFSAKVPKSAISSTGSTSGKTSTSPVINFKPNQQHPTIIPSCHQVQSTQMQPSSVVIQD